MDEKSRELSEINNGTSAKSTQQAEFESFMNTCRDGGWEKNNKPSAEAVTLACLIGWDQKLASEKVAWWEPLTQQVPTGILLLFLLATVSALYRYNLRLAGFHHSRADVLELSVANSGFRSADDYSKMVDAFAADGVEFGKASAPSDQAVSIVNSLLGRVVKT